MKYLPSKLLKSVNFVNKVPSFVLLLLVIFPGLSMAWNGRSLTLDNKVEAQTACDKNIYSAIFSGRTSGSATGKPNVNTNMRSNTTTSASILIAIPPNTALSLTGWAYGQAVTDIWTGKTDSRWFRVSYGGKVGWVASGVIYGNPPNAPLAPNCSPSSSNFYSNPEAFFSWAVGKQAIARLDTTSFSGQCVSLIARYVQEVKLPSAQRTVRVAYGNGIDTAATVASKFSTYFAAYTSSGLPKRGAVISFSTDGAGGYGHTGIVTEARYSNGKRQVRFLESNWDGKAPNTTVRVSPWYYLDQDNGYLNKVKGWTNPK